MAPVYIFEEIRLPIELLSATLLFLLPFAEKKDRFLPKAILFFSASILFSLLYFAIFLDKEEPRFHNLALFWYTGITFHSYLFSRFCFKANPSDALFFNILSFLTQNIVYCFYHCYVARILFPPLRSFLPGYVLGAVFVSFVIYDPVYFIFRKPLEACHGKLLEDTKYARIILSTVFFSMILYLLIYQGIFEYRVSYFDSYAWLFAIIACILSMLILYALIRNTIYHRETTILENMLRSSERYYELSKEHIAIINRKCHDLKHQLKALEKASEEERTEYIKEVEESIDFYQHLIYTDNEALNTILAEKGLFCKDKGISFNCSVDNADLSFIRLPDLYALLGNAVDNAIEYAETQENPDMRLISLRIAKKNSFIGIQVTNPYAGNALSSIALPETHKAHPEDHGFGLKSIRYIAEKYGGTMEYSTQDNLFTLQILIPVMR